VDVVHRVTAIAVACGIFGQAAEAAKPPVDTSAWTVADQVRIVGNDISRTDKDTRDIVSREQIDALYHLVSAQPGGWHRFWFDAPLLRWTVEFIREGKTVGSYGVGASFIEIYPYTIALKPAQQQKAIELLHTSSSPLR
jgi:hypothetical protein